MRSTPQAQPLAPPPAITSHLSAVSIAGALIDALANEPSHSPRTDHLIHTAARSCSREVAQLLKEEADRQLFIAPRRCLALAEAIQQLGILTEQPDLEAQGVITAADALRAIGRQADALPEYDRAARLFLQQKDDVGWARTRLGAAYARTQTLELGPALAEAERARIILAEHKLWVRLARLDSAIGRLLAELGRTQEALLAHTRATQAVPNIEDPAERELIGAEVAINQAIAYQRLDQYDHAEELLYSAAETFRRHGRPGPVATAESNLARGLAARGHVSRALLLVNEVRSLMLSLDQRAYAAMAGQVAVECLLELNRPTDAERLASEIVDQLMASAAEYELAKALLQRATAFDRMKRFSDAADDLARAETLFRVAGSDGWAAIARLHRAQAIERAGKLHEALDEASAASRQLHQRKQSVAAARADLLCASVLRKLGDLHSARATARAARAIARRSGIPALEYQAARVLAEIAEDLGDQPEAMREFAAAISALEKTQGRILTEQRAGFLHLEDKLAVYESAVRLCVQAGKTRRAFEFAERGKTRALLDALALRATGQKTRSNTPAARALADRLLELRRRYDRLSSTLLDPTPQDDLGSAAVAGGTAILSSELSECEARIEAVLDELRLTEADQMERLAPLQGKIYSALPYLERGTTLVQYALIGPDLVIFVLRRGHPTQVRSAPAGAVAQFARVRRLLDLNLQTALQRQTSAALERQAKALLNRLYDILIRPIEQDIDGSTRLIFVPHGVLHGVPFAALFDGESYLVERCEVGLAPSSSAVAFFRKKTSARVQHESLVVAHSADGELLGATVEGEVVADLFHSKRLFEAQATVANVRALISKSRLVHVAAHGQARPDAPLFSHVRLADGHLTALDLLDLSLPCELVTLSACETSHAVVAAGDEPIGLTRSLLYAGARSVIHSLWRVDDGATRRLMSEMYHCLSQGGGRAEALRGAQLTFLDPGSMYGQAHPAFWAAFSLVGEWGPLE